MEHINAKINTQIDEAIENVRSQICETYGAADVDDADEINNDLHDFVTEVMDDAFKSVRDMIKEELSKAAKPGTIASLEAKIDALLAGGVQPRVNIPMIKEIPVMRGVNNASNQWSRYQKAWYKWKRNIGESVPVHAGERSKLCAANYKEFKTKSADERENFLNEWA